MGETFDHDGTHQRSDIIRILHKFGYISESCFKVKFGATVGHFSFINETNFFGRRRVHAAFHSRIQQKCESEL